MPPREECDPVFLLFNLSSSTDKNHSHLLFAEGAKMLLPLHVEHLLIGPLFAPDHF